jgi:hypothetical protein
MPNEVENADLGAVLKRFLRIMPDARQITISTNEGAELMTETRDSTTVHPEDAHIILSLTQSFCASAEQSTRLALGPLKHIFTWVADSSILMQMKVESLVVSVLLDENANLGIVEEHTKDLRSILQPFCIFEG